MYEPVYLSICPFHLYLSLYLSIYLSIYLDMPTAMYGHARLNAPLCTAMYGCAMLCTAMYGYDGHARLQTAMHGYVTLCTAI